MTHKSRTLSLLAVLAFSAVGLHAQTMISSCPYTISSAGNYQLTTDITNTSGNCLTITAISGQVYIDGQGHKVKGYSRDVYFAGAITGSTPPTVKFHNTYFDTPVDGGGTRSAVTNFDTTVQDISSIEFEFCYFKHAYLNLKDDSSVHGSFYCYGCYFDDAGAAAEGFSVAVWDDYVVGGTHFHTTCWDYSTSSTAWIAACLEGIQGNTSNPNNIVWINNVVCNGEWPGNAGGFNQYGLDDCFASDSTATSPDSSKAAVVTVKNTTCANTYDTCLEFNGPHNLDFESNYCSNIGTACLGSYIYFQLVNSTISSNYSTSTSPSNYKCVLWDFRRSDGTDKNSTLYAPAILNNTFSGNTASACINSAFPASIDVIPWTGFNNGGIYGNTFTNNYWDPSNSNPAPQFSPLGLNGNGVAMWTDGGGNHCGSVSGGVSPYPIACPN